MKKFITLGFIDNNIYLLFLLAIVLIIKDYIESFIGKIKYDFYIKGFGESIGFMPTIFIPFFFKEKNKIVCSKEKIKDYFLLFIVYGIFRGLVITFHFSDKNIYRVSILCTNQIAKLIILFVIYFFLFKYKIYNHHIVSLVLFSVFSVIVDAIPKNFLKIETGDWFHIIIDITEVSLYCYIKYMMYYKYHKYWNIIFFQGVYNLIYSLIAISIRIILEGNAQFVCNYFSKENISTTLEMFFLV